MKEQIRSEVSSLEKSEKARKQCEEKVEDAMFKLQDMVARNHQLSQSERDGAKKHRELHARKTELQKGIEGFKRRAKERDVMLAQGHDSMPQIFFGKKPGTRVDFTDVKEVQSLNGYDGFSDTSSFAYGV
mmetsp:Transcript_5670/g.15863  ORF Transcript_5670/g.15863 Transcript_5670/m.15863 type:complete len:130 (+) Transcript_5670:182-571(+)